MVKSIIFYGKMGEIKIFSKNQLVYESYKLNDNDGSPNSFFSVVSQAGLPVKMVFTFLNELLTDYLLDNKKDNSNYHFCSDKLINSINYILEHLDNPNSIIFDWYQIEFEHKILVSSMKIEHKFLHIPITNKSMQYVIEPYLGQEAFDLDMVRKFVLTIKL